MKLVMVEWVDSCSQYGWHKPEEYDANVIHICSVGMLVREKDDSVSLISGKGIQWDTMMTIPRACIKRIRTLKVEG